MAVIWSYTKSTNTAKVTGGDSGTPANYHTADTDNAIVADRAGSVTLKAAAAPSLTFTLTYQITPVELRALIISFVIAAKTTQTDYIGITGTDAWNAAQTEVINVSAGNGTYVSTKRFRTITNICCTDSATGAGGTVWADGTLAVTQPQWGVFWDWNEVNVVRKDCKVDFGDGSTPTWFQEQDRIIINGPGVMTGDWQMVDIGRANSTVQYGLLLDETLRIVSNPCIISHLAIANTGSYVGTDGGNFYFYGSGFISKIGMLNSLYMNDPVKVRIWHSFSSYSPISGLSATPDVSSVYEFKAFSSYALLNVYGGEIDRITAINQWGATLYVQLTVGVTENYFTNINCYSFYVLQVDASFVATAYLDNVNAITWPDWYVNFSASATGIVYRRYYLNVNVRDADGNELSGAVCDAEDQYGTPCWTAGTVTTDANGDIPQQVVTYQKYTASVVEGTPTIVTYSPHKFTFSKAGYKPLVQENYIMNKNKNWDIELQRYESAAQSRIVSIGVM